METYLYRSMYDKGRTYYWKHILFPVIRYWLIRTKLSQAIKQGADYVVLYFPIESLYSKERILNGLLLNSKTTDGANEPIKAIYCIVESNLVDILKPPW